MNSTIADLKDLLPSGRKRRQQNFEKFVVVVLAIIAASGVIITTGIVVSLVKPTIQFFGDVNIFEFLGGVHWYPLYEPPDFGVWPLVIATFTIMLIAVIIAVPGGLAIAFFLNQYASARTRRILKPLLEILAGIPTVVFGFFALYFISPNIAAKVWPIGDVGIYSGLAAGITVGLMILPMMTTLAEDAMAAVPRSLIDGAYALGATRREVCTSVIFQAGLSGIIAAGVIAMSRAIGETTIVLLAAGSSAVFTFNPGQPMQTMSSFIGFAGMGDQSTDSTGYRTIFAVGSLLFVITFALNVISRKIVKRFREVYE
ncbi:MAG: phosphate ABC transporter permease subunit PstC [Ilumatobacteraceae bacterium]